MVTGSDIHGKIGRKKIARNTSGLHFGRPFAVFHVSQFDTRAEPRNFRCILNAP
jgi:hypothetical protein